jgi:hypothetical protein
MIDVGIRASRAMRLIFRCTIERRKRIAGVARRKTFRERNAFLPKKFLNRSDFLSRFHRADMPASC